MKRVTLNVIGVTVLTGHKVSDTVLVTLRKQDAEAVFLTHFPAGSGGDQAKNFFLVEPRVVFVNHDDSEDTSAQDPLPR